MKVALVAVIGLVMAILVILAFMGGIMLTGTTPPEWIGGTYTPTLAPKPTLDPASVPTVVPTPTPTPDNLVEWDDIDPTQQQYMLQGEQYLITVPVDEAFITYSSLMQRPLGFGTGTVIANGKENRASLASIDGTQFQPGYTYLARAVFWKKEGDQAIFVVIEIVDAWQTEEGSNGAAA